MMMSISVRILVMITSLSVYVYAFPGNVKGIQIKNNGQDKLWVVMTGEESFLLPPGQMASVLLEQNWVGTIFAKSAECEFKKCNTPHTLAELKFGLKNGEDHYKVSLRNGFNRPITIQPTNPYEYCKPASCSVNILEKCPQELQVMNSEDKLVACKPDVKLFHRLCPGAISADEDEVPNTLVCKKSNTYQVAIG